MDLDECFKKRLLRNSPHYNLKQNYVQSCKLNQSHVYWLDTYPIEKHETLYGLENIVVNEKDASEALKSSTGFLNEIRRLAGDQ